MKTKAPYKTRQQQWILDALASAGPGHITVAQLEEALCQNGTPVGTATLYRQLEKLVQADVVRKYTLGAHSAACYEYVQTQPDCPRHLHLKCEGCGELIHLSCEEASSFQQHIQAGHGFVVNQAKTVLYGTCGRCARSKG